MRLISALRLVLVGSLVACGSGNSDQPEQGTDAGAIEPIDCKVFPDAGAEIVGCPDFSLAAGEPFTEPSDFPPVAGCGVDVFSLEELQGDWVSTGGALWRFGECDGEFSGDEIDSVRADETGVVVRRSYADEFSQHLFICGRDGESFVGAGLHCTAQHGCAPPADMQLSPFSRIEGEAESDAFELVAEYRPESWITSASDPSVGRILHLEVLDDLAVVGVGRVGLGIIDVSDPERPIEVGLYESCDDYNDIALWRQDDRTWAVVAGLVGTLIFDITDPASPTPVTQLPHAAHRLELATIDGTQTVFLANGPVAAYELSPPGDARFLGQLEELRAHSVTYSDGRLYVNGGGDGLLIYEGQFPDVELVGSYGHNPAQYSHHSRIVVAGGRTVAVSNDELGPMPWIHIVDVDPGSPDFAERIGEYRTRPETVSHNIEVFGTTAFIAYYLDGIRALDLQDPTRPKELGHFNTWRPGLDPLKSFSSAFDVAYEQGSGLVYVADSPRGLMVLRPGFSP